MPGPACHVRNTALMHARPAGEAGSLSNASANFDKDGDQDFAVTIKSGAIRLYRNDNGIIVSVGEAAGLPVSAGEFWAISWGDYWR